MFFSTKFRCLIPGGGTGEETLFMAEQLNHTNSELIYLDFSENSMRIAQARSKVRRTSKIVWVVDWIESISKLGLGNFDLVISSGVLHHLKSPQKGLKIIQDIQPKKGGAALMVYGKYGRTGVYQIQHVLRIINQHGHQMKSEIRNAKLILKSLSLRHWFDKSNRNSDHSRMGDVGIVDLLLHSRDSSYTIQELHQWVKKSNYIFVDFSLSEYRIQLSLRSIVSDSLLFTKLTKMSNSLVQSISEILYGNMAMHEVYVTRQQNSEASLDAKENSIFAYGSPLGFRSMINEKANYQQLRNETFIFAKLERSLYYSSVLDGSKENSKVRYTSENRVVAHFALPFTVFGNFVLGLLTKKPTTPRTIQSLIANFRKEIHENVTIDEGEGSFRRLYSYLKETGAFLLKKGTIKPFPKTCGVSLFKVHQY